MDYNKGEFIRAIRTNLKMTQSELAKKANIDTADVNRVEKGKKKLTPYLEWKIVQAFEVSPEELDMLYSYHKLIQKRLKENADC